MTLGKREKGAHVWDRSENEWYVEPMDVTTALLKVERFRGQIWGPACGGGNIVKAAHAFGRMAFGTDLVDRKWDEDRVLFRGERDFLAVDPTEFPADCIITNPPFGHSKLAEAFVRHALASPTLAKLAAFVDIRFLAGAKRANGLYAEHPPSRIYLITPRCSCPPGGWLAAGNKAGNGSSDYVWIVWDRTHPHHGTLTDWLHR